MNTEQTTSTIVKLKAAVKTCSQCSLAGLCLPIGLNKQELQQLEGLLQSSRPYKENQFLFRQNDEFKTIYAVRSGMFKSYAIDQKGNERILGFHLPGEIIGLDAIYHQRYQCNVAALSTASVCMVPYQDLTELSTQIPSLQQQLLRLLSKEINDISALTYDVSVDQRLAAFIWGLSKRYQQRGYSSTQFNLSMPRRDIANHLNMAPETISRLFKRMQDDGLITLNRRELVIRDVSALKALAGCMPDD